MSATAEECFARYAKTVLAHRAGDKSTCRRFRETIRAKHGDEAAANAEREVIRGARYEGMRPQDRPRFDRRVLDAARGVA